MLYIIRSKFCEEANHVLIDDLAEDLQLSDTFASFYLLFVESVS